MRQLAGRQIVTWLVDIKPTMSSIVPRTCVIDFSGDFIVYRVQLQLDFRRWSKSGSNLLQSILISELFIRRKSNLSYNHGRIILRVFDV